MSLLIDGYNLMHAVGMLDNRRGPGVLEKARLALLNVLAESLAAAELPRTIVVFDAKEAPPGAPQALEHRGISVRFAARHEDADELIEELIRADSAPRRLTVVSSDHRLQMAARRRRAKAVDSEEWFDALQRQRRERQRQPEALSQPLADRENAVGKHDPETWLQQFAQEVLDEAEGLAKAADEDRVLPKTPPPRTNRKRKR